jgi:hypothetical protein
MHAALPYQGIFPILNKVKPFDPSRLLGIGDRFALLRGPNADQIWVRAAVPAKPEWALQGSNR